jgi:hypothetical protein
MSSADSEVSYAAVPRAVCGPGARPETDIQGRVPLADYESGRVARGYRCNARPIGHFGKTGGFKVHRYVDKSGHVCAYYDSTRMFPTDVPGNLGSDGLGVYAMDMSDPTKPVKTASLVTPAMQSPHESLFLNSKRGLLVAAMGNVAFAPGILDVYDVATDCRTPTLLSSTPFGVLGHESGFAPDGLTYYTTSSFGQTLAAIDLTDPTLPVPLYVGNFNFHGVRISPDGNTLYAANFGAQQENFRLANGGLMVLDVRDVQARVPNPQVTVLSTLSWRLGSAPQAGDPIVIDGHEYLIEVDEFVNSYIPQLLTYQAEDPVGAARLINVDDPAHPFVASNIRLQVHQPWARKTDQQNDPGVGAALTGYSAHYCSAPRRIDPVLVACGMIGSGLRVFNVEDPYRPREVAYFNQPNTEISGNPLSDGASAMSAPAWDPIHNAIWFTDNGLYVVKLTNGVSFRRR